MKNSDIEILIKEHESGIKILNDIKSINEDIVIYRYLLSGIINDPFYSASQKKYKLKIYELNYQKTKLVNKYKNYGKK